MVILTLFNPQQQTPLQQWRFEQESLIRIGRAPDNHVVLNHPLVSRRHLELHRVEPPVSEQPGQPPSWYMVNLSGNGTFLNGVVMARGTLSEETTLQLAQDGPILKVQLLAASPTKPIVHLPQSSAPPIAQTASRALPIPPTCTHSGNSADNLFCIHCGQPVRVEKTIRQYQVLRVLGRGGMGTTYLVWNPTVSSLASQPQLGLRVLKEMNADIARIPKAQELFEREASTLKALNHPGIPCFYDFFLEEGKKYLVMQLIHGQDLDRRIRQNGAVSPQQAIHWMIQTCGILDYLHSYHTPIIHRDIKPGNLLAQNVTNRIVVIDFGAVKAVGMPTGTRIGAEGYSAPEQTLGRPLIQSDLYAIGTSLIFLLTGVSPLKFQQRTSQGYRFLLESIRIPSQLRQVIERSTEPNPAARYKTAKELAAALERCL